MDAQQRNHFLFPIRIIVLFGAAAAIIFGVILLVYMRQSRTIERELQTHAALLLDVAEKGMRAHVRADRYSPEYIEDWFVGLMEAAHLEGFRLEDGSGNAMSALGVLADDNAAGTSSEKYSWAVRTLSEMECLMMPRGRQGGRRGPGGGPRHGMGLGLGPGQGWIDLPEGPYTFTLVLDALPWQERKMLLGRQLALGFVLAVLCISLLVTLMVLRERQGRLRTELDAARERATRQAVLAQLGAGLAHETKNPLGIIRGLTQSVMDTPGLEISLRQRLAGIVDETDRVTGQIDRFLSYAKPLEPHIQPVALTPLFDNLLSLLRDEAAAAHIRLETDGFQLKIMADQELLRRALLNLLLNAVKALQEGGVIRLRAGVEAGAAVIVVEDTGCGIAPEDLPHIKTPYFSKFSGGVGLGLALTDEIVRAHGWELQITSALGSGTEARLTGIPLAGDRP